MAPYAVAITKSISWRDQQERFANVYHFDVDNAFNTEAGWMDLANAVANKEKVFHGNMVSFVEATVWGPTDSSEQANLIRARGPLTGVGALTTGTVIGPELTVTAQWYLGRNALGARNRYLRKYYHVGILPTSGQQNAAFGQSAIVNADINTLKSNIGALKEVAVGGVVHALCTPDGEHMPLLTDTQVLKYLHVRQFRR